MVPKLGKKQRKPKKKVTGESVCEVCSLSFGVHYLRALICGNSFLGRLREIGLYRHEWADKNK